MYHSLPRAEKTVVHLDWPLRGGISAVGALIVETHERMRRHELMAG